MPTPHGKGCSHSRGSHTDIVLEAREVLFPLWVPLQDVLPMESLGSLEALVGQVDQKAQACLEGP